MTNEEVIKEYELPQIELDSTTELWLGELWRRVWKGEKANYKQIRAALLARLPDSFNPSMIDERLARGHADEITILGAMHAEPAGCIVHLADKVFGYIKDQFIADPDLKEITADKIAMALSMDRVRVQVLLRLASDYGNLRGGASHSGDGIYGYQRLSLAGSIGVFDGYVKYKGIAPLLAEALVPKEEMELKEDVDLHDEIYRYDPWTKRGHFNEEALLRKLKGRSGEGAYIDPKWITLLRELEACELDREPLIKRCEELNSAFLLDNYYSVGMLVRSIMDHVPPYFGKKNFENVAAQHGSRNVKKAMQKLDQLSKEALHDIVHRQARKNDHIPNLNRVDFREAIDMLLEEIVMLYS